MFNRYVLAIVLLFYTDITMAQQKSEEVRKIIAARHNRLKNIIVDYEQKAIFSPPFIPPEGPVIKEVDGYTIIKTGSRIDQKKFMFLEGRSRHEERLMEENRGFDLKDFNISVNNTVIRTFSGDRAEYLSLAKDGTPILGNINNRRPLPQTGVEIGLGMRGFQSGEWLDDKSLSEMKLELSNDDEAVLRNIDAKGIIQEWVFDRNLGYAITSYRKTSSKNDRLLFEAQMGDFKDVGGIMLPYSVSLIRYSFWEGEELVGENREIKVQEYRLDDPENTPERYYIKWPESARVYDTRSGFGFKIEDGQKRLLMDEDIYLDALEDLEEVVPTVDTQQQATETQLMADQPTEQTMSSSAETQTEETKDQPLTLGAQNQQPETTHKGWIYFVIILVLLAAALIYIFQNQRRKIHST
ncbi:MAG: hypothetical protein AMJ79_04550 [Phycisphaerae bacterium SM23_30]|nr:MAG: hypothetical protein AMJ79_04550 [Phycisphaerae bacterium SM23_30]